MNALDIIIALTVIVGFSYIGSVIIGKLMQRRQQTTSELDKVLFEPIED